MAINLPGSGGINLPGGGRIPVNQPPASSSKGKTKKSSTSKSSSSKSSSSERLSVDQILHMDLSGIPPVNPEIITEWILSKAPKNSVFRQTSRPIGEIFVEAAIKANVNVYYLVAHAAHETAWGTSSVARDKYNFFGIGAFDGSAYASAYGFSGGVEGGIIGGAMWISQNYINNPKYQQNTLYKMQNDPTGSGHNYATDYEKGHPRARPIDNYSDPLSWGQKIAAIMVNSPLDPNWVANNIVADDFYNRFIDPYRPIYDGRKIKGPGGRYDGEVFDSITGIYTKPTGVPAHYYEDDFSELPHRYIQGDYFLRIGDSRFAIPPTQIRVSETTNVTKFNSIRHKQSIKVQTGNKMRIIEVTLMFTDFDQINGYRMSSPIPGDDQVYYMDGLRALIAQMKTMPFLPVENEYLNYVHDIYAVALLSCNISVVDGFPGVMKAELTMLEFDPEIYLNKPAWTYDSHFMWPLFRWHYQRLLNGRTIKNDTLAPFIGEDVIEFWCLDERALANFEDEVIKQYDKEHQQKMKDGQAYKTWWDFNKLDPNQMNKMFVKEEIPHAYEIIDINATLGNTLTPLTPALLGKPVFQYFGSQDVRFNVLLHTQERNVVAALVGLKDRVDRYAREYRDRVASSVLRVQNNFINMLGVSSVMMESLHVETVPGSPDSFYISISLISFDETQYKDEALGHLDTIDFERLMHEPGANLAQAMAGGDIATFDNNIIHECMAEKLLDQLELYPDLDLPTYTEVNKAVKAINDYYKKKGLPTLPITSVPGPIGAKYVDPDFYFSYPSLQDLVAKIEKSLTDPRVKQLAALYGADIDEDLRSLKQVDVKEYFGTKAIAQIEKHQDADKLKKAYKSLGFDDPEKIASRFDEYRLYISDPKKYVKRFWIKAWMGEGGEWVTRSMDIEDGTDSDWKLAYYSKQRVVAQVKELKKEDYFRGMIHDMVRYDRRGTMLRAFPTYVFVLIDEGRYVNVRKLWDNYYTYHSLSEIAIHMSRKNPIHTAYIKLSNVYGTLNNKRMYHKKLRTPSWKDMVDAFLDSFVSNVTEKELLERTIIYDSIQLMAGARIHIRLGYGSCASQLPPVFNGIISEIDTGEVVTIVAQSFGYELTNEIPAKPGETNSMFEQGLEATELFRYYMTERKSSFTWAWRDSADPENYQSAYGIEHFGFLRVRDDQGIEDMFSGLFWDHEREINAEDYDIMKNVYSTAEYAKVGVDEPDSKDENNVRMQLEGKSPWDVFRTLERVTPEYVVYPHIHQFHYTLFFGKPWWDVQCQYILPPKKNPPKRYGRKISDYVELSKPFSQLHIYTSYGDIISNNIKAVGTDLVTAVVPVYHYGKDDETYEIVWADYYIRGSFQRTRTVDTTLVQDIPFTPKWMEKLGTGILNFFNGVSKYQKYSVRFAQAVVAESFRDMYQGELIVLGDPSVKPYDVMYIDDFYARMNGAVDVGQVVHQLSLDTGFITSIKPDLSVVINPKPDEFSEEWNNDPELVSGNFFRYSHIISIGALKTWQIYSMYKLARFATTTQRAKDLLKLARFAKVQNMVLAVGIRFPRLIKTGNAIATTVSTGFRTLVNVVKIFRGATLGTAAAEAAVPGPGWAAAAMALVSVFAAEFLLNAIEKMFLQKYNNVIKIFPLFYQGVPYVAGINGHRQLIPGWQDDGNGKPVRVEYGNVKKISPKKASEILAEYRPTQPALGDIISDYNDKHSYTDGYSGDAAPAKWLGNVSGKVLNGNPIFAAPISLGKEGKGFAGVKARITSGYRTSDRSDHMGLDFGRGGPNKSNSDILAFAAGEVMFAGRFNPRGYGSIMIIKHTFPLKDGSEFIFYSTYAHMNPINMLVQQGDTVKPGQTIAYMGAEGRSAGIHLHFEILVPKSMKEAAKRKRGKDTLDWVYAGKKPNRTNVVYQNPLAFMESILAYDSKLMKYVEFTG